MAQLAHTGTTLAFSEVYKEKHDALGPIGPTQGIL
jgi:uncharacterized protein YegP (UPF0339 family)